MGGIHASEAGERGFGADPTRCDHAASATAAVTGPMPGWSSRPRAGLALTRVVICLVLGRQFLIGGNDSIGDPDGLRARDAGGELFLAGAPGGDGGDLSARQRPAGIDPEIGDTHETCQGVDRQGPINA